MSALFALLAVFIIYPAAALVPAALFAAGFFARKRPLAGVCAVLWILYCGYEFLMKYRVLCSGECNIRVDLLLIYPVLLLVSLAGIVQLLIRKRKAGDGAA